MSNQTYATKSAKQQGLAKLLCSEEMASRGAVEDLIAESYKNAKKNSSENKILQRFFSHNKFYHYLRRPSCANLLQNPFHNDVREVLSKTYHTKHLYAQISYIESKYKEAYFSKEVLQNEIEYQASQPGLIERQGSRIKVLQSNNNNDQLEIVTPSADHLKLEINTVDVQQGAPKLINQRTLPLLNSSRVLEIGVMGYFDNPSLIARSYYTMSLVDAKQFTLKETLMLNEEIVAMLHSKIFPNRCFAVTQKNILYDINNFQNSKKNAIDLVFQETGYISQVYSIDSTFDPSAIALQNSYSISLLDFRQKKRSTLYSIRPEEIAKKRLYGLKWLQSNDQYFLVSSSNYLHLFDVRSPAHSVHKTLHLMDYAPPYIFGSCNSQYLGFNAVLKKVERKGNSIDYQHTGEQKTQAEELVTFYSPELNGQAAFVESQWVRNTTPFEDTVGRVSAMGRFALSDSGIKGLHPKGLHSANIQCDCASIQGIDTYYNKNTQQFTFFTLDAMHGITQQAYSLADKSLVVQQEADVFESFSLADQQAEYFSQIGLWQNKSSEIAKIGEEDIKEQNDDIQKDLEKKQDKNIESDSESDGEYIEDFSDFLRILIERAQQEKKDNKDEAKAQPHQIEQEEQEAAAAANQNFLPSQVKRNLEDYVINNEIGESMRVEVQPTALANKQFIVTQEIFQYLEDQWK